MASGRKRFAHALVRAFGSGWPGDALALIALRLSASGLVWLTGFRAISDDDYARVVIAQRFFAAPKLDASGTSWLPLPFWLQGTAMFAFGPSIETAQCVALGSGILSTLLVWLSARWLAFSRTEAFVAAAVASIFPYAARLGVATVPEQLTAALLVLGSASLACNTWWRRNLGALALCAATLSRYEAWPVAFAFAAWCGWLGLSQRETRWLLPAGLSCAGMLAWLAHGVAHHGDAFFFVERVRNYQAALGGRQLDEWSALLRHPLLLLQHEPELVATAGVGALLAWRTADTAALQRLARPLVLMLALMLFLAASDLRMSGATHHSERALLAVWSCLALVIGACWPKLVTRLRSRFTHPAWAWAVVGAVVGCVALLVSAQPLRALWGRNASFIDRSSELALGSAARKIAPEGRLWILADDYGYFAMIAAFGDPMRAESLDSHDPRRARLDTKHRATSLGQSQLVQQRVSALVLPKTLAGRPPGFLRVEREGGDYLLFSVIR